MIGGISFGRGIGYLAMSKKAAEREAKDPRLPAYARVPRAAVAKADRVGHARFCQGELREWLGCSTPSGVGRAIRRAVDLGLVHETSNARCLVLDYHDWQSGLAKGSPVCQVHD